MALALDHFFRAGIITLGSLVIIPHWRYGSMDKVVLPVNLNANNVVNDNVASNIPQADAPDTSDEDIIIDKNLDELNKKIKALKIDDKCLLQDLKTPQVCTLNEDQLKIINLPNKDSLGDDSEPLTIEGLDNNKTIKLTIEAGYEEEDFPETLRFTLKNTNSDDVEIKGDEEDSTLKPNIDYDYKISLASTTNDKTWLDNAWSSISHLGNKVGININGSESSECAISSGNNNKINVWKSKTEYVIGADSNVANTCPMDHEENVADYLEGFKLTVKGNTDISLNNGEGPTGGKKVDKITKNGVSYEIGPKRVKGTKKWFLIERAS